MDLIENIGSLTPLPHLSANFVIFRYIWQTVQQVQGSQEQLRELVRTIAQLLQTLDHEYRAARLSEGGTSAPLEDLHKLLSHSLNEISAFVSKEATRSFLGSLLTKDNRIARIDNYYHKVNLSVHTFQVSALCVTGQWLSRLDDARVNDQQTLNSVLNDLETHHGRLLDALDVRDKDTTSIIICLQRRLDDQSDGDRERQFFSHVLQFFTSHSGRQVEIESWMITSFEVELGHRIGFGGFGEVYKGVWGNTQVAVKFFRTRDGITPSPTAIRREIETWSTTRHPHVLQFFGANEWDERPFIVMPYLQNGNAQDYVRNQPDCDRLRIILHTSVGLMYLHERKIIHGDLKALNVLIDDNGNAVLCDFGLSRVKADTTTRTITTGVENTVGSRNWMSPERLLGGALKKPSDIYALGMTIYEIFANEVPLGDVNYCDFIELVARQDIRPERPDNEDAPLLSDAIWEVVEKCWVKDARKRPTAKGASDIISRIMQTKGYVEETTTSQTMSTQFPLQPVPMSPASHVPVSPHSQPPPLRQSPLQPVSMSPASHVPVSPRSQPLPHQSNITPSSTSNEATKSTYAISLVPALIVRGHTNNVSSVAFSPDGSQIISGSYDCTVRIWDAEMGAEVRAPLGHMDRQFCVSFSPDGKKIASGSSKGMIVVWDAGTGEKIADSFIGHTEQLKSIVFSPDAQYIASTSTDKTFIIWNAQTGQKIVDPFTEHTGPVCCVKFSPDSNRIVSGSHDRTVRVWDIQTRRLVYRPLVAHNYATAFVAFSFDGARIVSGDFNHTFCVWDAQTGALLFGPSNGLPVDSLNFPFNVSAGRIAVAPNGKWVAYSSCSRKDHTVSVWNSEIGCSALELVDGMVWEVAFSPDGKRFAMSSSDTIRVYDWPPADI